MSSRGPRPFEEFVDASFRELPIEQRAQLDLFTEAGADDEAREIWRLLCVAARATIEWMVEE